MAWIYPVIAKKQRKPNKIVLCLSVVIILALFIVLNSVRVSPIFIIGILGLLAIGGAFFGIRGGHA
ncbi:MAG: hypothetical protein JSU57_03045 [Candidatus Heimdallarchaeota archaeon]|nr:MAG: hypothetical protein JSU57_03045 [Candidatus Heimdallarchaeota archaeon]